MRRPKTSNCWRDRSLVLAWLEDVIQVFGNKGKPKDDAFFLAARRPNGTLTTGLWPDDYQSGVIYEAHCSFKRDIGTDEEEKEPEPTVTQTARPSVSPRCNS
jgi:hypothetical protein